MATIFLRDRKQRKNQNPARSREQHKAKPKRKPKEMQSEVVLLKWNGEKYVGTKKPFHEYFSCQE